MRHQIYHKDFSHPPEGWIFVFGSNERGAHGAGAARYARDKLGAVTGIGMGETGRCYAIPTKDRDIVTLSIDKVALYVYAFCRFVISNPDKNFFITSVGCGLAGFHPKDMSILFDAIVGFPNVSFVEEWKPYIELDI